MVQPRKGDVLLARLALAGSPDEVLVPAILLSDWHYMPGFCLAAPITAQKDDFCLPMGKGDCDCELAGGSCARFDGIVRLPTQQIVSKIGRVKDEFYWELASRIRALIE
jgi:mRNA-degrading endonuclease toxin of MazEF toxin-antitoxin module